MKDIFQYTNGDIKLASEDLLNIPEIKEIYTLKYNKGDGDHDGRKRLRFHNELMYVFFFYSHKSSIIDYEDGERDKGTSSVSGLGIAAKKRKRHKKIIAFCFAFFAPFCGQLPN